MDFEWDPAKSQRNEEERGLPFELGVLMFDGPVLQRVDDRKAYGEVRIRAIGSIDDGVILHCVYTPRSEVCRIISLRYANRKERDGYRTTYPG